MGKQDCEDPADTETSRQETAKKLLLAHSAYFDISQGYEFCGRTFFGYGEFHSYGEKYVGSKRAKLWEVATHEYLFIDTVEHLDAALVLQDIEFMKTKAISKVKPKPDHMSSNLSLVIVADSCDDDALRTLRKTRYRKNFKLGLQGWSDLRLAAVDLAAHRVVTNGAAKDMRKTLEANAGFSRRR